ncbi:MAG: DUF192 domain-containing protein [Alphaproteobacteria bacterium]|nr:DUF192 domain-containing protein [Alphaproteobacteria bacterium]
MLKLVRFMALAVCIILSACSKDEQAAASNKLTVRSSAENAVLHTYDVEMTDTKENIYTGLMGRTSLDPNVAFVFDINMVPQDMVVAMWMKDTLIPLDMLFVDEEGVVFAMHENAQPQDTTPVYPPKRPRAVLEINGGQAKEFGIKIGDVIEHPLFKSEK